MLKRSDIRIRDPFIITDKENKCYYMYGTTALVDGSLRGTWKQKGSKYDMDGGHAMLFETLDGTRMISLHSPNKAGLERATFFEY